MITHKCLANCLSTTAELNSVSIVKNMITSTRFIDMKDDVLFASSFTTTSRAKCRWIRKNALIAKTIIRFNFCSAKSKWSKRIEFQTSDARSRCYTRQNSRKRKKTTFDRLDIVVQSTLIHNEVTSSTSSLDLFIEEILTQNEIEILKSIMHLKTRNYTINEIINKRTLFQRSDRSMSSSFRQRFVSVVQMISNRTSNAFDVLKDHSNTRAS